MAATAEQTSSHVTASVQARRTWFTGGVLLLASTVAGALAARSFATYPGWYVADALYFAALLVFAFGLGRGGSITARRPLGTAAIAGLAVWHAIDLALFDLLFGDQSTFAYQPWLFYLGLAVSGALALIAVVQIARAGVVPAPWNRVPAWCLVAVVASYLVQLIGVQDPAFAVSVLAVEQIVRLSVVIVLAVLAIVLGSHAAPRPRETDRPAEQA